MIFLDAEITVPFGLLFQLPLNAIRHDVLMKNNNLSKKESFDVE